MKNVIVLSIRLGMGILFLYSGMSKARHPFDFLSAVYGYRMVGPETGLVIAAAMPWLEIVTGIGLIGGVWLSGAAVVAVCLCLVFLIATASAFARGLEISCGCFGRGAETVDAMVVLRAVALLGAATLLVGLVKPRPVGNEA